MVKFLKYKSVNTDIYACREHHTDGKSTHTHVCTYIHEYQRAEKNR